MFCAWVSGMPRDLDEITGEVIDTAVRIHRSLGPGLLESAYDPTMAELLVRRGFKVERQRVVGIELEGVRIEKAFVIDLLVEDRVIVEIKSVETLPRASFKQVLTYLRLMKLPVGLLLNFGASTMKEGIHRIVNGHVPEAGSLLRINRPVGLAPPAAQPPPAEGRVTVVEEGDRREP